MTERSCRVRLGRPGNRNPVVILTASCSDRSGRGSTLPCCIGIRRWQLRGYDRGGGAVCSGRCHHRGSVGRPPEDGGAASGAVLLPLQPRPVQTPANLCPGFGLGQVAQRTAIVGTVLEKNG